MKNLCIILLLFIRFTAFTQLPSGPEIAWQRCYGGSNDDYFTDAIHTSDGGILAAISTSSSDGDLIGQPFSYGWLIKFDDDLEIEWQKFSGYDTCQFVAFKIFEHNNQQFIFGGYTELFCGENHGNADYGLMQTDSLGNKLWQRSYGGPGDDNIESLLPTLDGGFLLTGRSSAPGGDIPFHYPGGPGDDDAIVIKTDSVGEIIWLKVLGGSGDDGPLGDIIENERGYYIINIGAHSNDYDLAGSGISGDKRWIVKLDSLGNIVDESFMSGTLDLNTYTNDMVIPYKDGFLIAGRGNATSPLYPTAPEHAWEEGAIAVFDENLELTLFKQWGGSESDGFRRVIRDENGNFYFIGAAASPDYDLPSNNNSGEQYDYWLFATDSNFNPLWSKNFGGRDPCGDLACGSFYGDILIKNNMLYAFIKNTIPDSFPDFDIECGYVSPPSSYPLTDAWLVALDLSTVNIEPITSATLTFSVYPNPANDTFTIRNNTPDYMFDFFIYDVTGRLIYKQLSITEKEHSIYQNQIIPGIYFVTLITNNSTIQTLKLIIQ